MCCQRQSLLEKLGRHRRRKKNKLDVFFVDVYAFHGGTIFLMKKLLMEHRWRTSMTSYRKDDGILLAISEVYPRNGQHVRLCHGSHAEDGKRKRGRPKKSWRSTFQEGLKEGGSAGVVCIESPVTSVGGGVSLPNAPTGAGGPKSQ